MSTVSPADVAAFRSSGMFDEQWYLERYRDVRLLGMDAAEHYLWLGARLGRKPSANFGLAPNLNANADIASAGTNPLSSTNPEKKDALTPGDLAQSVEMPTGLREQIDASRLFDLEYY